MRQEQDRGTRSGFVLPGIGLVAGAGLGLVAGLIVAQDAFVIWMGAGAALGLVVGAVVQGLRGGGSTR